LDVDVQPHFGVDSAKDVEGSGYRERYIDAPARFLVARVEPKSFGGDVGVVGEIVIVIVDADNVSLFYIDNSWMKFAPSLRNLEVLWR